MYETMKERIITEMGKVEFVCTTADIWSSNNKSFFGVTAHWLNAQTFERRSAALACRRITGRHTFDVIAKMLASVHVSVSRCIR